MNLDEGRSFDAWLDQANRELTNSVAARLDLDAALAEVKRRAAAMPVGVEARQLMTVGAHSSSGSQDVAPETVFGFRGGLAPEVTAAVDGDRQAIERLLASIRPLVVRYCRARVGRQERSFATADDVAQEVCLAVLTALPSYRDQGRPFLAFIYGIAAHKVANAHRSAARNRSEPVSEVPDVPDTDLDPEQLAVQEERNLQMNRLLRLLPDKQREILVLRVVVGLSAEETAEAVGSTPGAVRVAQHRALGRLRRALAAEEVG
jgi:RNA polymerase sigma-70 factor (ECF subfamily)